MGESAVNFLQITPGQRGGPDKATQSFHEKDSNERQLPTLSTHVRSFLLMDLSEDKTQRMC
jgi:hypothetical protein